MRRPWVPWLVGGGVLLAAAAARGAGLEAPAPGRRGGGGWHDATAPGEIRRLARPIEDAAGWPELGEFLVAVAWHESRGNTNAVNPEGGPNAARGWFQIRPRSSNNPGVVADPSLLLQPAISVALAADYAYRMVLRWRRSDLAGPPDWLAIRRGWACPVLVPDVDEVMVVPGCPNAAGVRQRFTRSLRAVGLPESFAYRPAPPERWPGQQAALGMTLQIAAQPQKETTS